MAVAGIFKTVKKGYISSVSFHRYWINQQLFTCNHRTTIFPSMGCGGILKLEVAARNNRESGGQRWSCEAIQGTESFFPIYAKARCWAEEDRLGIPLLIRISKEFNLFLPTCENGKCCPTPLQFALSGDFGPWSWIHFSISGDGGDVRPFSCSNIQEIIQFNHFDWWFNAFFVSFHIISTIETFWK